MKNNRKNKNGGTSLIVRIVCIALCVLLGAGSIVSVLLYML